MLLFVVAQTGAVAHNAQAATFSATLEPDTVAVGDNAALKLVFEGTGQIQLSPIPDLPGLVVSGPEQGRSVNIVNGQRTETVSVTYYLRPIQTNVFTIPSLQARIGDETFQSQPLELKAVNATQAGSNPALALLRLVVPREQLYVGEDVVVELQLLLQRNVSNVSEFELPSLAGDGWLAGQAVKGQQRQVQVGNQIMTVIPIRIPMTTLKAGTLTLGPVNSTIVVQIPSQRHRDDLFSRFGFGGFQQTEPRRVPLSLPAHQVKVVPLPLDNVPASFSGAIGQFKMVVNAGPTNVTVGDPITLRVQISGTGNMSSVSLPNPLVKGDFKTYAPEMKLDTTDDFGFAGTKTVEQIVIPENTEVTELPPIRFSFFEPESGSYHTLEHPITPLVVRPAGSRPAPTVALDSTQEPDAARQDIVHIKQRLGTPRATTRDGVPVARLIAWNSVPVMALLGTIVWRKRKEALERDPRLRRQQLVRRAVEQGLVELKVHSQDGSSEEFFATVFRLLQEQLGLVLDQPASAITESVVDEKLLTMGVSESTSTVLHELFQACNLARYAPTHDKQELAVLVPKLEGALRELQEVRS